MIQIENIQSLKHFIVVALGFGMTACGGLYEISSATDTTTNDSNKGIRFYQKVNKNMVTAVYQETWDEISLKATWSRCDPSPTTPPPATPTSTTSISTNCSKKLDHIVTAVRYSIDPACTADLNSAFLDNSSATTAYEDVEEVMIRGGALKIEDKDGNLIRECEFLSAPPPQKKRENTTEGGGLRLIGVSRKVEAITDVDNPKFINIRRSITGTTSATITLNADGTLASAAASSEAKFLELLLAELPIGEFISSDLGLDEVVAESITSQVVAATLSTKPVQRHYTVTAEDSTALALPEATGKGASWAVSIRKAGEKPKTSTDNAITFSGNVTLPKPAATPTKSN